MVMTDIVDDAGRHQAPTQPRVRRGLNHARLRKGPGLDPADARLLGGTAGQALTGVSWWMRPSVVVRA
jgi:hypothetical protein